MDREDSLLLPSLGRYEAHAGAGNGFTDDGGVGGIIFVGPHIGLDELRGHQLDRVSERREFAGPMMSAPAGLHADEPGLQIGEEH